MTRLYTLTADEQLVGPGLDPISLASPDALYRPTSYASLAEARTALGAPTDANYVMWNNAWTHIEQAFAALSPNDILVLPEREEPYLIDSSNGFMAAGVVEVDGTGPDGLKDGSRVPIVSNPRLWFEMSRARRGVLGLGQGAVIEPSNSGWTAPPQPIMEDEPVGQQFQKAYFSNGTSQNLVGAQTALMGYESANPFFANFTIKGRTFGGIAYSGIKSSGGTGSMTTVKRIHFDKCWRSHAGVPNGETGALTLNRGMYDIANCELTPPTDSVSGGSCIMWNNNTGGSVRHVRAGQTNLPSNLGGMWTFWRCGGVNVFEDVHIHARQSGMNIEENLSGFELDWTGGSFTVNYPGNRFHFVGNPTGGAPKVNLTDVDISPNGFTPGSLVYNVYSTPGVAKRSWITCNNKPVACVPSSNWIN